MKTYVECKIIQTSLGNIYFKQLHPYFVTIYPSINVWQTHLPNTDTHISTPIYFVMAEYIAKGDNRFHDLVTLKETYLFFNEGISPVSMLDLQ